MDLPSITQARAARAAVAAMWQRAMTEPEDPWAAARVSVTRIALGSYLNPEDPQDLPQKLADLLDRAQSSAYYARAGSEGEAAWKDLHAVITTSLDPTPWTPSESEGAAP